MFRVRATARDRATQADALVVVGPVGNVVVAPFFAPSSSLRAAGVQIDVLFFDGYHCADIAACAPARTDARPHSLSSPSGGTERRSTTCATEDLDALVAPRSRPAACACRGRVRRPAGVALAPGWHRAGRAAALRHGRPIRWAPSTGHSTLIFSPPLAAAGRSPPPGGISPTARSIRRSCWLDCTIDALSPDNPRRSARLHPGRRPRRRRGRSGTRSPRGGGHRSTRRGTPSGCRGGKDAGGAVSLDALVLGLFGSPLPPQIVGAPRRRRRRRAPPRPA